MPQNPKSSGYDDTSGFPDQTPFTSTPAFNDTSGFPDQSPYKPEEDNTLWGGLTQWPTKMYNQVTSGSKQAIEDWKTGNYPAAFHDITAPALDMLDPRPVANAVKQYFSPTPLSQGQATRSGLEMAGVPAEDMWKAYQEGRYANLAGQGITAAAMLAGPHYLGGIVPEGLSKIGRASEPSLPIEAAPPPPEGAVPHGWLPFDNIPQDRPPVTPDVLPTQEPALPFDDPMQQGLPFGAYRNPQGRFTNTGPGMPATSRPFADKPLQQELFDPTQGMEPGNVPSMGAAAQQAPPAAPTQPTDVYARIGGEPPTPPLAPPAPDVPQGSTISPDGKTVTITSPTAELVKYWKDQGFVPVGPNAEGRPQMVKGDIAPLVVTGEKRVPTPPQQETSSKFPGVDVVEIPNQRVDAPGFLDRMKSQYQLIERGPKYSTFKRLVKGEEGTFDPQQMWENLKRLFGRDPTPQEVEEGMQRQVQPGEETGRVAPFDRGFIPEENQPPPVDPAQLQQFLSGVHGAIGEPQLGDPLPDFPRDAQGNRIVSSGPRTPEEVRAWYDKQAEIQGPRHFDTMDEMPGPEDPRWAPTGDINNLRQQNVLGPRPVRPEDVPALQQMGQQELPWSRGENPLVADADMRTRELQAAADRLKRPQGEVPEQLSMKGQMQDAEIASFLRGEDGTPPEMRDLPNYKPTGIIDNIKKIANDFLKDDSGTVDHGEIYRRLRNALDRIRTQRGQPTIAEETGVPNEELRAAFDVLAPETEAEAAQRQRVNDSREIYANNDPARADEVTRYWERRLEEANTSDDTDAQKHAANMLREARNVATDLRYHGTNAEIQARTEEPIIEAQADPTAAAHAQSVLDQVTAENAKKEALRAARGVPNPPIEFGLQDLKELNKVRISKEQLAVLETANPDRIARAAATERMSPRDRKRNTWDEWAMPYLDHAGTGEPGLTIHDRTSEYAKNDPRFDKYYEVVYRNKDGNPVAMAKVNERAGTGVRSVPILAADRTKGFLYGRAVRAVGQALVKMNATEAKGIISDYTARLIAKVAKSIGSDAGSFEISKLFDTLQEIKNDVLGGRPLLSKKFKTADDVVNLVDKMSGGQESLPWLASKAGDETGAVNLSGLAGAFDKVKQATGWGMGASKEGAQKPDEFNFVKEALAIPNNATTMMDLSAPGRQGLSMILTPEFWKAGYAMFKSLNYDSFKQIESDLMNKPIMKRPVDPTTGKVGKSYADQVGIKLFTPASEGVGPRAEQTASRWLEMGVGNGPIAKAWRNTAGVPIRMTNRAYITFLNHLSVNRTETLLNLARDMSIRGLGTGETAMPGILGGLHLSEGRNIGLTQKVTPTEAMNMDPYHNLVLGKEIADFVNTATGHAPLKTHLLPLKQAEVSLESAAGKLGYVLFSPRLLASRIRMMNPSTYIMASPLVRMQYAKSALATTAAWYVASHMIKMAAGPDAEVSDDPTSADFGKVRVGDARLDLGGGFLQFATAYGRAYIGGNTSSASGAFHRFGSGYQATTQEDTMQRFFVNKLNPVAKFAYDVASASEYNPVHVGDRTVQLFVPLFMQDLQEIYKENPSLLPMFGTAALFGGGSQVYSKGESVSKFIDPENDWNATGGGVRDLMPWNWNADQGNKRTFPWSDPSY